MSLSPALARDSKDTRGLHMDIAKQIQKEKASKAAKEAEEREQRLILNRANSISSLLKPNSEWMLDLTFEKRKKLYHDAVAVATTNDQLNGPVNPASLFCLTPSNPVRKLLLKIARSSEFDTLFTALIFINALIMGLYDPLDGAGTSVRMQIMNGAELPFQVFYTIEMVIKIIAFGAFGEYSYTADKWNWLDGAVVIIGWLAYIPQIPSITALRIFRLLRSVRKLQSLPAMRIILASIIQAGPGLTDVFLLVILAMFMFGVIGVQLWSGLMSGACGYVDTYANFDVSTDTFSNYTGTGAFVYPDLFEGHKSVDYGFTFMPVESSLIGGPINCALGCDFFVDGACTPSYGVSCPDSMWVYRTMPVEVFSGNYMPYTANNLTSTGPYFKWADGFALAPSNNMTVFCLHNPLNCTNGMIINATSKFTLALTLRETSLSCNRQSNPDWGQTSFDNVIRGMFTSFVMITTEGWSAILYNLWATWGLPYISTILVIIHMLFGACFLLELTLAVLWDQYSAATAAEGDHVNAILLIVNKRLKADEESAARIAAGEVIEKPVIRELSRAEEDQLADEAELLGYRRLSEVMDLATVNKYLDIDQKLSLKKALIAARLRKLSMRSSSSRNISTRGSRDNLSQQAPDSPSSSSTPSTNQNDSSPEKIPPAETSNNEISEEELDALGANPWIVLGKVKFPCFRDTTTIQVPTDPFDLFEYWYKNLLRMYITNVPRPPAFLQEPCYAISISPSFESFFTSLVLANVIMMGCSYNDMTVQYSENLDLANTIFVAFFVIEALIKMVGFGFREFMNDGFNVFDFVIITISVIDIISKYTGEGGGNGTSALRTFRIFRVMKLIKSWGSLRILVTGLVKGVMTASNAFVLLFLIIYIFSLLGLQIYGPYYDSFLAPGQCPAGDGQCETPYLNFQNLWWSVITVFQVMDNENWDGTVKFHMMAFGWYNAFYFLAIIIIGNYIFLNLFITILMSVLEDSTSGDDDENEAKEPSTTPSGSPINTPEKFEGGPDSRPNSVSLDSTNPALPPVPTDTSHLPFYERITSRFYAKYQRMRHSRSHTEACLICSGYEVALPGDHLSPAAVSTSAIEEGTAKTQAPIPGLKHAHINPPDEPSEASVRTTLRSQAELKSLSTVANLEQEWRHNDHIDEVKRAEERLERSLNIFKVPPSAKEGAVVSEIDGRTPHKPRLAPISASSPEPPSKIASETPKAEKEMVSQMHVKTSKGGTADSIEIVLPKGALNVDDAVHGPNKSDLPPGLQRADNVRVVVTTAGNWKVVTDFDDRPKPKHWRAPPGSYEMTILNTLCCCFGTPRKRRGQIAPIDGSEAASEDSPESIGWKIFDALADFIAWPSALDVSLNPIIPEFADPFFFSKNAFPRRELVMLYTWPWFEQLTLTAIVISCVNLALDEPRIETCKNLPLDNSFNCVQLYNYLSMCDLIITWYFTAELVISILCKGLFVQSESMLRNGWAILDVVVVSVSLAGLFSSGGSAIKSLRSLRAFRALRALRAVSRLPALRLVIDALFMAVPKVKETVVVVLLFMYIFAVIGLQNFSGGQLVCSDSSITTASECTGYMYVTGGGCSLHNSTGIEKLCRESWEGDPSHWVKRGLYPSPWNFNDIGNAMLTVFELVTGENWPVVMQSGTDNVAPNVLPISKNTPEAAIYFIMIEIVLNQLLIELFTGIIIDTYLDLRTNSSGLSLLTDNQKAWVDNMKVMLQTKPVRFDQPPEPKSPLLSKVIKTMFNVSVNVYFDTFIMVAIIGNLIVMAMYHHDPTPSWLSLFSVADALFTAIFCLEFVVKILGLGPKQYFGNMNCCFDFVLVFGGVLSLALDAGSIGSLLRIFRVGRVLRLVRYSSGLTRLMRTVILSLPSLGNVAGLMFLVMYVFAIIAMNLFSGQRYGSLGFIDDNANFDSFGVAYFTMFRCMTGENFNGIMHELMMGPPFCIPDPGPGDNWTELDANCPTPWISCVFWVFYFVIISFMVVNILVAVVMEAFDASSENGGDKEGPFRLTPVFMDAYLTAWNKYDINGTQYLDSASVINLIMEVPFPLGLRNDKRLIKELTYRDSKESASGKPSSDNLKAKLHFYAKTVLRQLPIIPTANGTIHFHALLHALMDRASGGSALGMKTQAVEIENDTSSDKLPLNMLMRLTEVQRKIKLRVRNRKLEAAAAAAGVQLSDDVIKALAKERAREAERKATFLARHAKENTTDTV